jgi:hypothetical protein
LVCLEFGFGNSRRRTLTFLRLVFGFKSLQASETGDAEHGGCVLDPIRAHNLITSAKLVVGFHPDQATEPCIDLAIAMRKPFVVCPCCVFPKQFPDRRLAGRTVSSYEDFISYGSMILLSARARTLFFAISSFPFLPQPTRCTAAVARSSNPPGFRSCLGYSLRL